MSIGELGRTLLLTWTTVNKIVCHNSIARRSLKSVPENTIGVTSI